MINRIAPVGNPGITRTQGKAAQQSDFGAMLQEKLLQKQTALNFSKHAMNRVEERGIELTPDLMDKLAGSVEKAQEKGAVNILAFGGEQAFIINVPHSRVITTISQEEMKEKIFTNIDSAVLM